MMCICFSRANSMAHVSICMLLLKVRCQFIYLVGCFDMRVGVNSFTCVSTPFVFLPAPRVNQLPSGRFTRKRSAEAGIEKCREIYNASSYTNVKRCRRSLFLRPLGVSARGADEFNVLPGRVPFISCSRTTQFTNHVTAQTYQGVPTQSMLTSPNAYAVQTLTWIHIELSSSLSSLGTAVYAEVQNTVVMSQRSVCGDAD
eukprot:3753953-Amphidinium_carterae.1